MSKTVATYTFDLLALLYLPESLNPASTSKGMEPGPLGLLSLRKSSMFLQVRFELRVSLVYVSKLFALIPSP